MHFNRKIMSGTLNKVMLIGHLGDEVKLHYFESGDCVGRFPLATNETFISKKTNERVTNTEWHTITVRNKGAEICEKYLSKGDKVYVEGRIKSKKWMDDKGVERYSTEIQCSDFTFLTTKKEKMNEPTVGGDTPSNSQENKSDPNQNDDLPF